MSSEFDPGAPRGIHDDCPVGRELRQRVLDDDLGPALGAFRVDLATHPLRELFELIDRGRSMHVRGHERHADALLLEVPGELRRRRGLPLPEEPGQEDPLRLEIERSLLSEHAPDLLIDDPDEEIPEARARRGLLLLRPPTYPCGQLDRQLDVDVGLEERALDVPNDLGEQGIVYHRAASDLLEDPPQRFAQCVEDHVTPPPSVGPSKNAPPS